MYVHRCAGYTAQFQNVHCTVPERTMYSVQCTLYSDCIDTPTSVYVLKGLCAVYTLSVTQRSMCSVHTQCHSKVCVQCTRSVWSVHTQNVSMNESSHTHTYSHIHSKRQYERELTHTYTLTHTHSHTYTLTQIHTHAHTHSNVSVV